MTLPIVILPKEESVLAFEKRTGIQDTIYYVVTADGVFIRKRNPLYDCLHEAELPKCLGSAKESLILKAKPVPRRVLNEIIAFLAEVCVKYDAEGVAMLYYHPEKKEWAYIIPEQETTEKGLHVEYKMPDTPEGFVLFGSVHSHAGSSAFQSGTDHNDECNFEGVHITVGKLPDNPELHVRFHACGSKWDFKNRDKLVESITPKVKVPEGAMEKVSLKKSYVASSIPVAKGEYSNGHQQTMFNNMNGWSGDGSVYCTEQKDRVHPLKSRMDHYPVGQVLRYKGEYYIKTNTGWKEMDSSEKKSLPPASQTTEVDETATSKSSDGTSTGGTEWYEEIPEEELIEIMDVRDSYFGEGTFREGKLFGGQEYHRTVWGWETDLEEEVGHYILPLSKRKELVNLLDIEERSEMVQGYNQDMLRQLLSSGWTPQDCLMALVVENKECQEFEDEIDAETKEAEHVG